MKVSAAFLLLVVGSTVLGANRLEDGFYASAENESGVPIVGQDGTKYYLGDRKVVEIEPVELYALDNGNTQFRLSLRVPHDVYANGPWPILVVDGIAFKPNGSGSNADQTSWLMFPMSGLPRAEQVAKDLATPLFRREHPGYALRVTFAPSKEKFVVGEDVTVTVRIENVGDDTISFVCGGRNRAARDNQYIFSAYLRNEQVPDIGTTMHFGGLSSVRSFGPGEAFEHTVNLKKWFAFDQPGRYEIFGLFYLEFKKPGTLRGRTIWEDYASADFTVTISD